MDLYTPSALINHIRNTIESLPYHKVAEVTTARIDRCVCVCIQFKQRNQEPIEFVGQVIDDHWAEVTDRIVRDRNNWRELPATTLRLDWQPGMLATNVLIKEWVRDQRPNNPPRTSAKKKRAHYGKSPAWGLW
ncbi:hypothetical protein F1188_16180 [Roseospira marina]|uniref:Uncharacterized protein n=1 Tax=Roseospira marina TaxID=140057 RepID=A0A5M6I8Y2_9PROT|nr:hypothetical protein [Roseospira marina]KAA5604397.1 hypothetical protein F1188_16180 [Roseospira marina]MBB4315412.1 hypothetical protein [Roseospira marina]MBB5088443.1 hypothetical protein [Roseospira marina]